MNDQLTYTGALVVQRCWCGIRYAIPEDLDRWHDEAKGNAVFCPLGHQGYRRNPKPERDALAAERARVAQLRAQLDQEQARSATIERSRNAMKGQVTKARKRAAATQCPVGTCHRNFTATKMRDHIATCHPSWEPEPSLTDV